MKQYIHQQEERGIAFLSSLIILIVFNFLPVLSHSQVVTVTVKFATAGGSPKVSFADLKYNKQSVLSMDVDDQPANVMSIKALFQGGVAPEDGLTYPGKFFTDGCGNKKPFTLGVAVIGHNNSNDGDLTLVPSLLSTPQLDSLIAAGFSIENHGYYHEQNQYYIINGFTEPRNILENTIFIYEKTGFVPRVWVTPSNYSGYNPYVEKQGYLAATSQNVTDNYVSQPVNMWTDHLADLSQLDSNFNVFLRDFNDDWSNSVITDELKSHVATLRSKSSETIHKIYRLGTHSYNSGNWPGFQSFINYVDTASGNTIWVTSLQELLEYLEVKRKVVMTQSVNNNILTITLDMSKVSPNNRSRDISLLVNNSAAISSVSVSGADGFSYNSSGLINIYNTKTLFDPPYKKLVPNAGADQQITLPSDSVFLIGRLVDSAQKLSSYLWTKISGPDSGTILSPSSISTQVKGLVQGKYVFRLSAIDDNGIRGTDDVTIDVISIITPGSVFHLEAEDWSAMKGVMTENCSDSGGTLDVGWIDPGDWMDYALHVGTQGFYTLNLRIATPYSGGQLVIKNSAGSVLSTLSIPATGGFQKWQTFSVPVTLNTGLQILRIESLSGSGWNINWLEIAGGSATNQSPVANAGADQSITLPANSVTLSGSGTDADGSIASYSWTKVSEGSATINNPTSPSTIISGLAQGSYIFRLTVTDNAGATASDDVLVTVSASTTGSSRIEAENYTAMSGVLTENCSEGTLDVGWIDNGDWMDYTVSVPSAGSYAINLRIATPYSGSQLQIKNSGGGVLATVNLPLTGGFQTWQTTTATISLAAGTQTIRLQSTGSGWNINWLEIAGGSATNQSPVANAGADQSITLPANSVTLSGSGTDADGSIASYSWTKVSGGSATINNPTSPSTIISGLAQGSYIFRLTVTDNAGATASDDVLITVNAAANQSPVANAGADQSITLPANSVTLTGSGTDADGSIASYAWTKLSGGAATITSPSSASTTITGLVQGSYTFRLTVTDNGGAIASDDVLITVNAQPLPNYSVKIEAETFTNAAPVTTPATTDVDGGLQVSSLDNGDALNYSVNLPYSGTYTANFRVGATKGGSKLQLYTLSGTLLATINIPNTGTAWQTVSVSVNLAAGAQTLVVKVNKSSGNPVFNWWELNLASLSAARAASNTRSEVSEASITSSIQLYPTPARDQLVLEMNNSYTGNVNVQILNIAGAIQKKITLNKTTTRFRHVIYIGDLPQGEYILLFEINNEPRTEKIIKL